MSDVECSVGGAAEVSHSKEEHVLAVDCCEGGGLHSCGVSEVLVVRPKYRTAKKSVHALAVDCCEGGGLHSCKGIMIFLLVLKGFQGWKEAPRMLPIPKLAPPASCSIVNWKKEWGITDDCLKLAIAIPLFTNFAPGVGQISKKRQETTLDKDFVSAGTTLDEDFASVDGLLKHNSKLLEKIR
eukprot:scaffold34954_cov42-Attheya_sp.AAC.1